MKSVRYNAGNGKLGIHSGLMKTLIDKNSWEGSLKMPKPQNHAELALLSKFIFGVELSVRFEYFTDSLSDILRETKDNDKLSRLIKLRSLNKDKTDYFPRNVTKLGRGDNGKLELLNLRYWCKQSHNSYYDGRFNHIVFNSCYELDSYFWRHCIGEIYCGGIGDSSYGQVSITSIKEYKRLLKFDKDQRVRTWFKNELNELQLHL